MATMPCPIYSWERGGHGCGDELHRLIAEKTGEDVTHDCGCGQFIAWMNQLGPAGCREHVDEIAEKMRTEGEKRGWWMKLKVATDRTSETLSSAFGTKRMIERSISQAELWEKKAEV
jgi:hypothetical protein